MTTTTIWSIFVVAVFFAGLLGFAVGRRKAPGGEEQIKSLMQEYEAQLAQKQAELEGYRQQVHQHYDKTAQVFMNMAGSYKELFDHLSVGYEQLGNFSENRILPDRAGALLDGPDTRPKENGFMSPDAQDEDALKP